MALSSSTQSMAVIFHMGVVSCIFLQKFPYFQKSWGSEHSVYQAPYFSTHAQEPGSKAMIDLSSNYMYKCDEAV